MNKNYLLFLLCAAMTLSACSSQNISAENTKSSPEKETNTEIVETEYETTMNISETNVDTEDISDPAVLSIASASTFTLRDMNTDSFWYIAGNSGTITGSNNLTWYQDDGDDILNVILPSGSNTYAFIIQDGIDFSILWGSDLYYSILCDTGNITISAAGTVTCTEIIGNYEISLADDCSFFTISGIALQPEDMVLEIKDGRLTITGADLEGITVENGEGGQEIIEDGTTQFVS